MEWITSSYSTHGECVAVAWQKSSQSEETECVEIGTPEVSSAVFVRNSHDPGGPILEFTPAEWDAFLAGVKKGEFDSA